MASLAVVIYAGLAFGYKNFLETQIDKVDNDIQALAQSIPQEEQENLIKFYSQLANLENILDKHILSSKIFPLLQANTNQLIFYNVLELKTADRRLTLDGVANSYQIFAQQLAALNNLTEVEKVSVNESYLSGDGVSFRISIILNSNLFY